MKIRQRRGKAKPRYGDRYDAIAKDRRNLAIAHQATGGICCWCTLAKSHEIHHAQYMRGDVLGRHTFPVCAWCHSKLNPLGVHAPRHWIIDKIDPARDSQNTPGAIADLRKNYQELRQCTASINSNTYKGKR